MPVLELLACGETGGGARSGSGGAPTSQTAAAGSVTAAVGTAGQAAGGADADSGGNAAGSGAPDSAGGTPGSDPSGGNSGALANAGAPSSGAGGNGGASPTVARPFDWVGVIGTGQSLAVGVGAGGFISPTQPYGNLALLDRGSAPQYPLSGGNPQWSLVPLVEPMRANAQGTGPGYGDGQYPNNIFGETPHSGMANALSWLWKQRDPSSEYVTLHTTVGWSGHCLSDIDKAGGKRAYPASLSEARAFSALAKAQGKTFGSGGIIVTHGECDSSMPDYGTRLYQLQQDYDADLKRITGQTKDVVMLVSQQSTQASGSNGSAAQVFRVAQAHPGQLICTGPKYQYQYASDKTHLQAGGYRRLGEKYAEVFDVVVNQRLDWQPLGPTGIRRTGNVIEVSFHVPNPPLVWNELLAPPHQTKHTEWAAGRGFEVSNESGQSLVIESAQIQGSSVLLTLKDAPAAGVAVTVGYALTQDGGGSQGGDPTGLRGQLRDSDPFLGGDAETIGTVVTQGSRSIKSATAGAFKRRTALDIISQDGQPTTLAVTTRNSDDELTLSAPWSGPSGTVQLSFRYDLYNYCVHFSQKAQ